MQVVSTKQQLEKLVALMEENPQFARGICTKVQAATKGEGLALELNCLGPPTRPAAKWMKGWADMKSKTKKKLSQNKAEYRATGGGTNHNFQLHQIPLLILRLKTLKKVKWSFILRLTSLQHAKSDQLKNATRQRG